MDFAKDFSNPKLELKLHTPQANCGMGPVGYRSRVPRGQATAIAFNLEKWLVDYAIAAEKRTGDALIRFSRKPFCRTYWKGEPNCLAASRPKNCNSLSY